MKAEANIHKRASSFAGGSCGMHSERALVAARQQIAVVAKYAKTVIQPVSVGSPITGCQTILISASFFSQSDFLTRALTRARPTKEPQ